MIFTALIEPSRFQIKAKTGATACTTWAILSHQGLFLFGSGILASWVLKLLQVSISELTWFERFLCLTSESSLSFVCFSKSPANCFTFYSVSFYFSSDYFTSLIASLYFSSISCFSYLKARTMGSIISLLFKIISHISDQNCVKSLRDSILAKDVEKWFESLRALTSKLNSAGL